MILGFAFEVGETPLVHLRDTRQRANVLTVLFRQNAERLDVMAH